MPIASGLSAQVGWSEETTYGTAVTVAKFAEFNQESVKLNIGRIESKSIRAANRVLRNDRWIANKKGAAGDLEVEVQSKGMGLLFKHMLGSSVITTPGGATLSRKHRYILGDIGAGANPSLTVQVGRPDIAGTVQPFTYKGVRVKDWEMSCDVDGILMLKLGLDAQDETTATGLAAASFPATSEVLNYVGGSFTLGGTYTLATDVVAGGTAFDVMKFNVKSDNKINDGRYFIRANTLKKAPILADLVDTTVTADVEFNTLTDYNRFANGTTGVFYALFAGSTIETTFKYQVEVIFPVVRFDGETPTIQGNDVTTHTISMKPLFDGTNDPLVVTYQTTDTVD